LWNSSLRDARTLERAWRVRKNAHFAGFEDGIQCGVAVVSQAKQTIRNNAHRAFVSLCTRCRCLTFRKSKGTAMKIGALLLAGLLTLVALPGCGSSDDAADPKQQCDALITRYCGSAIACEVSGGLLESSAEASENASCKSDAGKVVDCAKAQSVTSKYDACMNKLANPPCDDVNQAIMSGTLGLPSECNGVILVSS
jgi:hypothetical protein